MKNKYNNRLYLAAAIIALVNSISGSIPLLSSFNAFWDVIVDKYGAFSFVSSLNKAVVADLYNDLFLKLECQEKVENCSKCIDMLSEISSPIPDVSEWNSMALKLMYSIINITDLCQMTELEIVKKDFKPLILSADAITEEEIELLLDYLHVLYLEDDHHDLVTTSHSVLSAVKSTAVTAAAETTIEAEKDDHDHHEEEGTSSAKCFGESTLLYYLGLDHGEEANITRLPEVVGYLMSFVVRGWKLSENCTQVLPRQADLLSDLFTSLGNGEAIIDEAGFKSLLSSLSIGSVSSSSNEATTAASDDHDHAHKRSLSSQMHCRYQRSTHPRTSHQCLSESSLASIYNLNLESGITKEQFLTLCPALIQQQAGGHCAAEDTSITTIASEGLSTAAEAYGYGTLAVIIISLLSVIGAVLIPCLHSQIVSYGLDMFVALGIGTMLADALLHLIPQALGLHSHEDHGDDGHDEDLVISDPVLIQITVCAAVYGFFLFETLMSRLKPSMRGQNPIHSHSHNQVVQKNSVSENVHLASSSDELSSTSDKPSKISTVALLILLGDGIHNFMDGIAIGAAFAVSTKDGFGTSLVVFCHELPHELGDFSILLQSGVSKCRALLLNALSASMCLVGLYIGVALGQNDEVRKWLIALTAGMFIYISLVDMLPELMSEKKEGRWINYFIVQNIGMILGIMFMFLLAVFEEDIAHL